MKEDEGKLVRSMENLCPCQDINHVMDWFFSSLSVPDLGGKMQKKFIDWEQLAFVVAVSGISGNQNGFSRVYS